MGHDIFKFPSAKHFCSWLRLSPNNKLSGGKIISSRTPKGKNRISLALRQAANSVGNQKTHPLSPFFRKIAFRKGRGAAVTATARKLAIILYHMITRQEAYRPFDYEKQLAKNRLHEIAKIKTRLSVLALTRDEIDGLIPANS
jgi:transposase